MIIGIITVYKCDDCNEIKVVHTDRDVETFARDWFVGTTEDYCGGCRHKMTNQAAIEAQESEIKQHTTRVAEHVRNKIAEAAHAGN